MRILDLGSGKNSVAKVIFAEDRYPGREIVTLDINPKAGADVVADVCELPEDIGKFDIIIASHILEHIERALVLKTIHQWIEHLKIEGQLHVLVPDLTWGLEALQQPNMLPAGLQHVFGGQGNEWQYHKCGFTVRLLRSLLRESGLRIEEITTGPYGITIENIETGELVGFEARQMYGIGTKMEEIDYEI